MKKSLLALAVLGAFAGAASAQSSVTVYGIVDLGFSSIDNGAAVGRTNGINSGNQSASRIGFKGTEDLGGSLKANFVLEQGIWADTGNVGATAGSTTAFNRLATVGLSGSFGAVNLGRQTSAIKDAYDQIDPFADGGSIAPISNIFFRGLLNSDAGRISNSIKYTTNSYAGFKGNLAYGFGENAGSTGANSNFGLGLGYVNGPLNVQFGYHNQDVSTAPAGTVAAIKTAKNKLSFLGATYDFGVVKLHGAFADTKVDNVATADVKYRNWMLGVSAPVGAAGNIFASYSVNDNRTTTNADSKKAAIMYTYDLSKRTNLYTGYSRTSNDNGVTSASGYGGLAALTGSTGNAPAGANGENTSVFTVGVRHKF